MLTIDNARAILRNDGVRLTPQRLMIVQVLIGRKDHPTVEQIYDIVRAEYPAISLATVYNTVSLLARHHLISALHGCKDGLRLDPMTAAHAHSHCIHCGAVNNVPIASPVSLGDAASPEFVPEQVEVSIFGRCNHCDTDVLKN